MTTLQTVIIKEMHTKPTIDIAGEIRARIDFIKTVVRNAQAKGIVLGISGGQDSTLAGRLNQLAVNELNDEGYEAKFVAVRLPYGIQRDASDAIDAISFIQPTEQLEVNVKPSTDAMVATFATSISDYHKGNIKARMRMIVQYAIAGEEGLIVSGTSHSSEYIGGYETKHGDAACDYTPLMGLNKRQGKALLMALGAPEHLYLKVPTADLLDNAAGQPDEKELGVTYEQIDDYLEGKTIAIDAAKIIEDRFLKTVHKRMLPMTIFDI